MLMFSFFLVCRLVGLWGLSIVTVVIWIVFLSVENKLCILSFELNLFFIIFVVLK